MSAERQSKWIKVRGLIGIMMLASLTIGLLSDLISVIINLRDLHTYTETWAWVSAVALIVTAVLWFVVWPMVTKKLKQTYQEEQQTTM